MKESVEMSELYFKDIIFGKTDASNELNEVGNSYYMSSFLEYDKYQINDFVDGRKCFVLGRKGTGKTALLKYLECRFVSDSENLVIPIRFKSDFDEIDRKNVKNASICVQDEVIEDSTNTSLKSYVMAWQVYLIYQIFRRMYSLDGEYSVFVDSKERTLIWKLLKLIYGESGGNKIVPKISKGYISVSAGTKGIDTDLAIEIEFHDNKVNYEYIAKKIVDTYRTLQFDRTPVYVLVDELELSVKTKKLRDADIALVRDLILAVDKMNGISKERSYSIKMYASVRTDVIDSVLSSGYEINKCIEDYGVTVEWYQRGGDYRDNPLLCLLEKKIKASEQKYLNKTSGSVWGAYFAKTINNIEVRRFLLNYSWYRPRDVVRMMQYLQEFCERDTVRINQEVFDRAIQRYSSGMWNEVSEEMSLRYSPDDMKAIKKILTGISVPFDMKYFNSRMEILAKNYVYVEEFSQKYRTPDVLDSLFDWGIIGNSGERMVFSFLGYKEMDITKPMIIHTPLRNYFEVVGKNG